MLPADCYEAARVDGISPVKVFFKVTLPLIRPALMVAMIFRALDALRIFDLIYVLTSNSRDTISMSGYRAPAARRLPGGRLRLGRGDAALPHHRRHHGCWRSPSAGSGSTRRPRDDAAPSRRVGFWLLVAVDRRSTRSSRSTTRSCPRCARAPRCSASPSGPRASTSRTMSPCSASSPSPATSSTRSSSPSRSSRSRCSSA